MLNSPFLHKPVVWGKTFLDDLSCNVWKMMSKGKGQNLGSDTIPLFTSQNCLISKITWVRMIGSMARTRVPLHYHPEVRYKHYGSWICFKWYEAVSLYRDISPNVCRMFNKTKFEKILFIYFKKCLSVGILNHYCIFYYFPVISYVFFFFFTLVTIFQHPSSSNDHRNVLHKLFNVSYSLYIKSSYVCWLSEYEDHVASQINFTFYIIF